ncbi:MAG TPA: MBL fold metallo-hydrolase, partial [Acidimicrobiales bacterium]
TAVRLASAVPGPKAGVEAWFFPVGKGRSILVSSIGGGSVLLDAGTGTSTRVNTAGVQRLVEAIGAVTAPGGPARVPRAIRLSHADADHYNAARALLAREGFSRTAVEVAVDQLGRSSGGRWTAASLTVQPGQRLVTVAVEGGPVHVRRTVLDDLELVELRSVAAHRAAGEPGRRTFNRNRTSPVVVVHDLVSGSRMLFTADAEGRQFDEIVRAVGPEAMRRLLGGPGGNLRVVEAPHHFGQQRGPDAIGLLNMLQLAYESGRGDTRLLAQTTAAFAGRGSSSFTFLEVAGGAPERVEGDPSPAGQVQATRVRGGQVDQVTLDTRGVEVALRTLRAHETALHATHARLREVRTLRLEAEAMQQALAGTPARALAGSVAATLTELTAAETRLGAAAAAVWDTARAVARSAGDLGAGAAAAGRAPLGAALGRLRAERAAVDEALTRTRNGVEAHLAGLTVYARLYANAATMVEALSNEDITTLYRCRAEHTELVRAAAGVLGRAEVADHVRAAWAATRAAWSPARVQEVTRQWSARIAHREMSVEFRALLADALGRQAQLDELAARAMHGTLPRSAGPGGAGGAGVPAAARGVAGVVAALEVIRIGLDLVASVQAAEAADEQRAAVGRVEGVATMSWWLRRGITPQVALTERSAWSGRHSVVYEASQEVARQAALAGGGGSAGARPAGVPAFDRVVVTGVPGGELRRMVTRLVAELASQGDWASFASSYPPGEVLRRVGGGWGLLLWSADDQRYRHVDVEGVAPGLGDRLDRLHRALDAGQQTEIDAAVALAGGEGATRTVGDSSLLGGLLGEERVVTVYDERGVPLPVDFGDRRPRFLRRGTVAWPPRATGPLELVQAADLATHRRLAEHWWVTRTGGRSMDAEGRVHDDLALRRNADGLAYVHPGVLEPAPEAGSRLPASGAGSQ